MSTTADDLIHTSSEPHADSGHQRSLSGLAQRSVMDFRIARLSLCVEGFAGLRDSLDLRDILEIETFCAKLEQPEVTEGN